MMLILLINEHSLSSRLFVSSFSYLSGKYSLLLMVPEYKSFTSLVKFPPRHFVLFHAFGWDCFLNSHSDSLLLLYKNATYF